MKQPVERRLAAILAADMVGYSRLMGEDEEGTHERVTACLTGIVDPKVAQYRGRIVPTFSFRVEKAIKLAHRRQPPRQRGGLEAAFGETAEKSAQIVGVGAGDRSSGGAQMRGEVGEVVAISVERILAGAALGRQHVEEQLDQRFIGCSAGHRLVGATAF